MARRLGLAIAVLVLVFAGRLLADDKKIDVEAEDQPVRDVIARIAAASGKQIVVDKEVDSRITISLKQIGWKEGLEVVSRMAGLKLEEKGALLVVSRAGGRPAAPAGGGGGGKAPFREYPVGDEIEREKEHMRVAAVWLPPVTMDHDCGPSGAPGPYTIHLECDVAATRGNTNGFAVGDWIPYMTIEYEIRRADAAKDAKPVLSGKFMPMVAKDGPHYGATIEMPGPGRYKLTYKLQPPSSNGFGRHTDAVTGVAEWWAPFEASFDWDYKGVPASEK